MPYSGTWEQTKKMRRVIAVLSIFWLNRTCEKEDVKIGFIVDGIHLLFGLVMKPLVKWARMV